MPTARRKNAKLLKQQRPSPKAKREAMHNRLLKQQFNNMRINARLT